MAVRDDWDEAANSWSIFGAGMGALRVTLLFGSAAVALALIVAPIADRQTQSYVASQSAMSPGIDFVTTGSIGYRGTYTERRSVLQSSPNAVCIIRDNGLFSGEC